MSVVAKSSLQGNETFQMAWYVLKRNPLSVVGFGMVLILGILAILAPVIVPHHPEETRVGPRFAAPSRDYPMGTDQYGRDIFSRVIYAARIDMTIALAGVLMALVAGCALGGLVGFYGGRFDSVVMRLLDSQQAFPTFILAMVVATALGHGLGNVILVIAFVDYPIFVRLVRAEMMSAKESMYAEAARCAGNSNLRIIFRHLLPNCMGPVYVTGSLLIGGAVMLVATLSFLGLGVRPPTAEWGLMVSEGSRYIISGRWWMSLFPGFMVWFAMFGWNLLGDGLQDIFDPKRR